MKLKRTYEQVGKFEKYYGIRGAIIFLETTNRYWRHGGGDVVILRNKNFKKIGEFDKNEIDFCDPEWAKEMFA